MLRTFVTSSAAVALAVVVFGSAPASAQDEAERLCNPVLDGAGNPVVESDGDDVVTHLDTYECPPEPEVAAVAEPAEPEPAAPPPPPLPEQGVVYFAFDDADLTSEGQQTIDSISTDIQDRELGGITVVGHTDTAGSQEYNQQLSEQRAENVAAELIRQGIPATIVEAQGEGEDNPAVDTPDGTPLQANRRATIDFSS